MRSLLNKTNRFLHSPELDKLLGDGPELLERRSSSRERTGTACCSVYEWTVKSGGRSEDLAGMARRFWQRPLWRGWATFSVACGLLTIVFMTFFGLA